MRYAIFFALLACPALAQEPMPGPFAAFDLASEPVLADPHDLAIGPDGRLYVADKFGARIAVFDPETLELIGMLGEGKLPGVHDISFGPGGVAVAVTGARGIWVLMTSPRRPMARSGWRTIARAGWCGIRRNWSFCR